MQMSFVIIINDLMVGGRTKQREKRLFFFFFAGLWVCVVLFCFIFTKLM